MPINEGCSYFKPSTKEAYDKQNNQFKPRYYKCIKVGEPHIFTLNKIYDFESGIVDDGHKHSKLEIAHLKDYGNEFELSTKEEFDKQNNKTEFIVGKWYKFSSYSENTNVNYAKLKELDNAFTASDWIINKIYEGTAKWSLDHIFNPVLLTDLSEIQEYLPDNHPDKQNNILNIDKILEEAKLKYPIGTQFQPAHVISGLNVVTAEDYYWENDRKDSILVTSDSLKENWTGCLYKNGKWATIMEPVKPVEPKSKYRIAAEKAMKKFSDIKIGDLYITTNGYKYKATRLPEIVADSNEDCYIDCGLGYLWKYETPHKVGYKVIKSLTPIEETPIISLNDLYESPSMFHALDYKETLKEIQPTESITNQLLNIKLNNY
jgi:flagellar motor protein MotB